MRNGVDLALRAEFYHESMDTQTLNQCGCGCGTMTTVTAAQEGCGCGCECCGDAPKDTQAEVAELRRLRDTIDQRLAQLGT
jgi:hypothetical protein